MKSKKKFLLLGVGAMGALALGVGATSTFAWFTATTAANVLSANGTSQQLTTAESKVSLEDVGVTFTFSTKQDTAGVELHRVAVAGDNGTKDAANNTLATGDIIYGAMANGVTPREYQWDGNNSAHRIIGEYQAVASWTSGAPTGARLEALKGNSFTFEVSAAGNAKILTADSGDLTLTGTLTPEQKAANLAAAKVVVDGTSTHAYVTISFGDSFNGTISNATVTLSNPYYTIKANNPTGLEWDDETDTEDAHESEYHTLDKISVEEISKGADE